MKIRDFRVGNMIFRHGGQLDEVTAADIAVWEHRPKHLEHKPVLISGNEAILERLGFHEHPHHSQRPYTTWMMPRGTSHHPFRLIYNSENKNWKVFGVNAKGLLYIHQLQNLFYALYHEELRYI